jgi:hypothetical protein
MNEIQKHVTDYQQNQVITQSQTYLRNLEIQKNKVMKMQNDTKLEQKLNAKTDEERIEQNRKNQSTKGTNIDTFV